MGDAAEQSEFYKKRPLFAPNSKELPMKRAPTHEVPEVPIHLIGKAGKMPYGGKPVKGVGAFYPIVKETDLAGASLVGGFQNPPKPPAAALPGSLGDPEEPEGGNKSTASDLAFAHGSAGVELTKGAILVPVNLKDAPPIGMISTASGQGSKPLKLQPFSPNLKQPPIHLVGGSENSPKPSAAQPVVSRDYAERLRKKIAEAKPRTSSDIDDFAKAFVEDLKGTSKRSDLEDENRALVRTIVRLQKENDELRKAKI